MLVQPITLAAHFDQVAAAHQEMKQLLEQPGVLNVIVFKVP
jgi:hypothetical protein